MLYASLTFFNRPLPDFHCITPSTTGYICNLATMHMKSTPFLIFYCDWYLKHRKKRTLCTEVKMSLKNVDHSPGSVIFYPTEVCTELQGPDIPAYVLISI
jgi:hypothetical protein